LDGLSGHLQGNPRRWRHARPEELDQGATRGRSFCMEAGRQKENFQTRWLFATEKEPPLSQFRHYFHCPFIPIVCSIVKLAQGIRFIQKQHSTANHGNTQLS